MEWTVCGWLWYTKNAVLRKFGSNRNLFSSVLLVILSVTFLCTFHVAVLKQRGGAALERLTSFGSIGPLKDIAQEVVPGLVAEDAQPPRKNFGQGPSLQGGGKKAGPNRRYMANKGKKMKPFNHRSFVKKGGIGNRRDRLMFPWSDPRRKIGPPASQVLAKPKLHTGAYQDDVVVGGNIEWTKEVEKERRKELRQRSLKVKHECEKDDRGKLRLRLGKVYEHLKWATNHGLIYCPIFKAGSTTWMKNLLTLARETHFNGSLHAKVTSLYPTPNGRQRIENLLQKSLKFMIVRHPFERLLSAYRDKMLRVLKTDDPYRQMQLTILKDYGHIGTNASSPGDQSNGGSPKETSHPSFLQFLYKVRDEMQFFWKIMDGAVVDPHWTPYWYSCAPCQIQYDIIAKMETLDLDQEFIIHAGNLQDALVNARTHASKFDGYSDSETAANEYFKVIPLGLLKELEQLYWPDFKLFGYDADKYFKMTRDGE
ncbi:carbohydrate sulfotransferase 13-like [Macrobrachium nipponense]|uniref:carbohydrate sulfotransferase 13-like n=1 Tax=Macrobrachium nipponense TaxID=159736 RepID=UPI0030C8539E